MDRLKLNTKALLGMATRTVDQDHEMRHTCVKSLNQAVAQYEISMTKFVTGFTALTNSLEGIEKAYKEVVANEKQVQVFDGIKEITSHLETLRSSVCTESSESFKTMLIPSLSTLKVDCEICDRIHNERAKAVDLYDYHRDVVEKKEVQYASKGKLLDDSKRYKEDIGKRDAANEEYLKKHTEYNKTYDELLLKKSELTTLSAKLFLHWLSDFAEKLHREAVIMCGVVDKIVVQPMETDEIVEPKNSDNICEPNNTEEITELIKSDAVLASNDVTADTENQEDNKDIESNEAKSILTNLDINRATDIQPMIINSETDKEDRDETPAVEKG